MNGRLQELYREAIQSTNTDEHLDMPNKQVQRLILTKYAELIVRKCIDSTLSLHNTAIDNEWNLDETFHVIVDTIVEDLDMQHIFRS
jgi:hypothetical protein